MIKSFINTKYKKVVFFSLFFMSFIYAQDQPPVLTANDRQVFCPGSEIKIAPSFTVSDPDSSGIESFSAQISVNYQSGEDRLSLDVTPYASIGSAIWSTLEGKLTLKGSFGADILIAELQIAVREIFFTTTATTIPDEKVFSLTIGNANYLLSTDHFYEFISDVGITWANAKIAAEGQVYYDRLGYLATLTSQEESDFAGKQTSGAGWIGGSDEASEGVWKWVTGPEAGTIFWNGLSNGSTPNFAFWNSPAEPNDFGFGEDYAHVTAPGVGAPGSWNDLSNTGASSGNYQPKGYIVEYGAPGDALLSIVATTSIYLPKITSFTADTICIGDDSTLYAYSRFGDVFWFDSPTATTLLNTGDTYVISGLTANKTYYVSAIEDVCALVPRTAVTVSVEDKPEITSVTTNSPICSGSNAVFVISGTPSATVNYNIDGGVDQTVILSTSGEAEVSAIGVSSNTVFILTEIFKGTCSISLSPTTNSTTVIVNPNPEVITLTSNASVCVGEDAIFTIKGTAGAEVIYSFDGGTTASAIDLNAVTGEGFISITGVTTDIEIELISIKVDLCLVALTGTSVKVTINPDPSVNTLTAVNPMICSGSDALFSIIGSAGATVTYSIDGGLDDTVLLDASGEGSISLVGVLVNSNITLSNIVLGSCAVTIANTASVIVNPNPEITLLTAGVAICSGGDATFTIKGSANAEVTYSINGGANQTEVINNFGEASLIVMGAVADTTIELISIRDITTGCLTSLTGNIATVVINLNPTITSTINTTVCIGEVASLNATASAGVVQWFASDLSTDTNVLFEGTDYTPTLLAATTTYYVAAKDGACVTPIRAAIVATVTPIPTITNITEDAVCLGTKAQLSATASSGIVQWFATDQATDTTPIFEGADYETPIITTTTTYYVAAKDGACISKARNPVTAVVDTTTPNFDIEKETYFLCLGEAMVTLKVINEKANNYTYIWEKEGELLAGDTATIGAISSGNYTVKAISITGCESIEKSIVVIDSEIAIINKEDIFIVDESNNNTIEIRTANLGIGKYVFSLDNEFGFYTSIPFFDKVSAGNHILYVKDRNGCGTTLYDFIVFAYPNFFTPNEDGINDFWKLSGFDTGLFTISQISIFNRFGVLLYQSENPNKSWDGTSNGKKLPSNTYWFKVVLNDINGIAIEKRGSVSLIRK